MPEDRALLLTVRDRSRTIPGDLVNGMFVTDQRYMGADLSLTSSGMATLHMGRMTRQLLHGPKCAATPAALRGTERLDWLERQLADYVIPRAPKLLALEGYSYGSKNSNLAATGEWGGIARLWLRRAGIETVVFSPTQVKKFATGNHQAKKPEVVLHLNNRWAIAEPQDDKADACVLAIMAACLAEPGCVNLTQFQKEVLSKIEKSD